MITAAGDTISGIWNTTAGGDSTLSINGSTDSGGYTSSESPAQAIDNNTNTKYVNFGNGNITVNSTTKGVGTGFYVTPAVGLSTLSQFRVATADDRANRDPLSATIECSSLTGSNLTKGSAWTLVYSGSTGLSTDPGRTTYGSDQLVNITMQCMSYRIIITSQRAWEDSTQYSEFELFGWY